MARRPSCSVKDSFATLDLAPAGFQLLFDARWFQGESVGIPAADWHLVETAQGLDQCKAAHGDANAVGAELLGHPDVRVLASVDYRDGLIANRSSTAVGISNVFGSAAAWTHGADTACNCFPGLPLVGWQRGDGLAAAVAADFEDLGPLRVWLRGDAD